MGGVDWRDWLASLVVHCVASVFFWPLFGIYALRAAGFPRWATVGCLAYAVLSYGHRPERRLGRIWSENI